MQEAFQNYKTLKINILGDDYITGVNTPDVKRFNSENQAGCYKSCTESRLAAVKQINSTVRLINTLVLFEFGNDGLACYAQGFGGGTFIILVIFQGLQNEILFQAGQLVLQRTSGWDLPGGVTDMVRQQVRGYKLPRFRENDQAFYFIFQFPDIAGPIEFI